VAEEFCRAHGTCLDDGDGWHNWLGVLFDAHRSRLLPQTLERIRESARRGDHGVLSLSTPSQSASYACRCTTLFLFDCLDVFTKQRQDQGILKEYHSSFELCHSLRIPWFRQWDGFGISSNLGENLLAGGQLYRNNTPERTHGSMGDYTRHRKTTKKL
jgi:hypothetical protein